MIDPERAEAVTTTLDILACAEEIELDHHRGDYESAEASIGKMMHLLHYYAALRGFSLDDSYEAYCQFLIHSRKQSVAV